MANDQPEPDLVAEIRALRVEIRALMAALRVSDEARDAARDEARELQDYMKRLHASYLAARAAWNATSVTGWDALGLPATAGGSAAASPGAS
jgi:hypothetical protein